MVRSAGVAPASSEWRSGILLLNDGRNGAARAVMPAPLTTKKNKHHCKLGLSSHPLENFTAVLSVF